MRPTVTVLDTANCYLKFRILLIGLKFNSSMLNKNDCVAYQTLHFINLRVSIYMSNFICPFNPGLQIDFAKQTEKRFYLIPKVIKIEKPFQTNLFASCFIALFHPSFHFFLKDDFRMTANGIKTSNMT